MTRDPAHTDLTAGRRDVDGRVLETSRMSKTLDRVALHISGGFKREVRKDMRHVSSLVDYDPSSTSVLNVCHYG